jgi:hypothetical protein
MESKNPVSDLVKGCGFLMGEVIGNGKQREGKYGV